MRVSALEILMRDGVVYREYETKRIMMQYKEEINGRCYHLKRLVNIYSIYIDDEIVDGPLVRDKEHAVMYHKLLIPEFMMERVEEFKHISLVQILTKCVALEICPFGKIHIEAKKEGRFIKIIGGCLLHGDSAALSKRNEEYIKSIVNGNG